MPDYFSVKNWEKFQHYKDRTPPWIKLHRDLLRDYEFSCLQDASKLHLMLIWLLASQMDNKIPLDPEWLRVQLGLKEQPDLKALSDAGFIESDSTVLAECTQVAVGETETETETEAERETENHRSSGDDRAFEEWWAAYPKKVGKKTCKVIWKRRNMDTIADTLMTDVKNRQAMDSKWRDGYIPNPQTYLNGDRWEDEISTGKSESLVDRYNRLTGESNEKADIPALASRT